MSSGRPIALLRIAVAIIVGDVVLRERLVLEVETSPDLVWSEGVADVLIVDGTWSDDDGRADPVVLVSAADPTELPPRVRALLPLDASVRTIVSAARLVAEGLTVLPDSAMDWSVTDLGQHEYTLVAPAVALTPREKQVLQLLAAGASNKVIARLLNVSVHTVKFHVASVLRKLGAGGRLEAVGIGLRTGLVML
jgi:DNA-binding CsgD family transcriptional regulator